MHDEPVWARIGNLNYDSVSAPHGYGAPRFDRQGCETAATESQRDGDVAFAV